MQVRLTTRLGRNPDTARCGCEDAENPALSSAPNDVTYCNQDAAACLNDTSCGYLSRLRAGTLPNSPYVPTRLHQPAGSNDSHKLSAPKTLLHEAAWNSSAAHYNAALPVQLLD